MNFVVIVVFVDGFVDYIGAHVILLSIYNRNVHSNADQKQKQKTKQKTVSTGIRETILMHGSEPELPEMYSFRVAYAILDYFSDKVG